MGSAAAAGPLTQAVTGPGLSALPFTAAEQARISEATALPRDFTRPQPFEALAGGAGTVAGAAAFSSPLANLLPGEGLDFRGGQALFDRGWVSAPSSTIASDGLGPLFNARSCLACHPGGGRGAAPKGPGDLPAALMLQLSVPDPGASGIEGYLAAGPDPVYGRQIQPLGLPGLTAEGRPRVAYDEIEMALSGGESALLRRPRYELADPGYGPLGADTVISPRIAPGLAGLGLLEAIPEEAILALADPEDEDGDGISGRASLLPGPDGRPVLGRFGWTAAQPTLEAQIAHAFAHDIGLSSPLYPEGHGDCTPAQTACRAAPDGGDPEQDGFEISATALDLVTRHSRHTAVPARRDAAAPGVLAGKKLFHDSGCAACHRPAFVTRRLPEAPALSFQLIWPYSDLLLHDMGEGLAGGGAGPSGREWRTPPLWGLGLARALEPQAGYLHDGRARSLLEAVLWHGGEAAPARDRVATMPAADRAALIRFLESL
ncbi:di-heme oxidoredictase family protein [Rhodovulum sp. YEN HP10]|uniref:di-heme oxidoreductase family protein n=1 Tax=Rhodovulum sp. HP10 TaxID=3387397 RepID=UPI0039DF65DE